MATNRNANKSFVQDDWQNIKEYVYLFLDKRYWILMCTVVGVVLSYLIYKSQAPVYQVEASMLVIKDTRNNSMANLFEESKLGSNTMVDNQVGIIRSYALNREVMEQLNWRANWYRVGTFTNRSLYKAEPFVISETPGDQNIAGVPLHLKVLSSTSYRLSVNEKADINGATKKVKFSQDGQFGRPFISSLFNFTLQSQGNMVPEVGAEYLFYFNDIKKLVTSYISKLDVRLQSENSEILVFRIKGIEPFRDIDYLNELCRTHILKSLEEKNKGSESAIRFIDLQLSGISDSLHLAARRFSDFRSTNKVMDLTQKSSMASSKLAALESDKSLLEMRLKYIRNLQNYIGNAEQMKQVVAPSLVGISDPVFNNLVASLIELYRKREILSYSVSSLSPNLDLLEKEIKMTSKTLTENIGNILTNAESELLQYNERIAEVNSQISDLPVIAQQMNNIQGRFEMNNEMNNFLLKKKAEASITKASNEASARTLDSSLPETMKRLGPDLLIFLVVGFLLGLMLPILVIVIHDFFNDKIHGMEQLMQRTNLPVIGSIAHNNFEMDNPVSEHPRSAISESFRGLRSNLQFLLPDAKMNVLSVHSSIPGEGKTFVSMNLASIFAMNSKKVLLVECDLRKPGLKKIMDIEDRVGLSNYLIGKATLKEIIRETKIPGLYFVPSGPIPPNPAELLENASFEVFIGEVRQQFDFVVLDNAPISIISDCMAVGSKSDANLFVLRQEYSHKDQITYINEIARHNHLPKVILALNDVQPKGFGYGTMRYGNYNSSYQYSGGYYSDSPGKNIAATAFNKVAKRHKKDTARIKSSVNSFLGKSDKK